MIIHSHFSNNNNKKKVNKTLCHLLAPPNFLAPEDLQSLSLYLYIMCLHILATNSFSFDLD